VLTQIENINTNIIWDQRSRAEVLQVKDNFEDCLIMLRAYGPAVNVELTGGK